jgi:integrase
MHLYKRKDSKFWWFKFSFHGKVYQQSTGTKNRRDAEGIASKARLNVLEGKADIKRKKATPLFKDAMAQFLAWSAQHHAVHPNTTKRYETASKPLLVTFGAKSLDAITPDEIEKYKTARLNQKGKRGMGNGKTKTTGRTLKPATVNRELACLKAVINHFIKLDVMTKNPASKVKLLAENNEQMRVLSFEEERLYLAAASQPLYDIAVLMLETGVRPDEAYKLKPENVDLEQNTLAITFGKTKAARRKLPLTKRAALMLRQRIATTEGNCLFPAEGNPDEAMGKVNHAHYGALKRSGVASFRLYDLRHTFASRAAMSGVDLVTLAALLGHSKIQMVLRYAHPTAEHQVSAIKKLESFTLAGQMAEATASAFVQ